MRLSIQSIKQTSIPILKASHVSRTLLFGSFARGEQHTKSDIDLLIDFEKEKGLFDLLELRQQLEHELHHPVDLVTFRSLSPLIREQVLREGIKIL